MTSHIKAGIILSVSVLAALFLLFIAYSLTSEQIKITEQESFLSNLDSLLPYDGFDNDPYSDAIVINTPQLGGSQTIYPVYQQQQRVGLLFTLQTNYGYSGPIELIMGLNVTGNITGVRVTQHAETPGLGDKIDYKKSNWLDSFVGLSLNNTHSADWSVKKYGGKFDAFTGATVSPKAVIDAVENGLLWYRNYQLDLTP